MNENKEKLLHLFDGVTLIAQERQDQLTIHSRSIEQDIVSNKDGQLAEAAEYLLGIKDNITYTQMQDNLPKGWNHIPWFKMCTESRRKRLILAATLIAAELDRTREISIPNSRIIRLSGDIAIYMCPATKNTKTVKLPKDGSLVEVEGWYFGRIINQ